LAADVIADDHQGGDPSQRFNSGKKTLRHVQMLPYGDHAPKHASRVDFKANQVRRGNPLIAIDPFDVEPTRSCLSCQPIRNCRNRGHVAMALTSLL
jgi:hypothetical protein